MRVYFVRHGESELNATRTHQHSHTPLSSKGREQAKAVAERLKHLPIDCIYASDYERAKQTAEIINDALQKELTFTSLLRERKRPSEVQGKQINDFEVLKIQKMIRDNWHDPEWHYSDEENFFDVKRRAEEFISVLQSETKENIAVVTHGGFSRFMVSLLMFGDNLTPELFDQFYNFMKMTNTGITMCEHKGDNWKLLTWNDYAHLAE